MKMPSVPRFGLTALTWSEVLDDVHSIIASGNRICLIKTL